MKKREVDHVLRAAGRITGEKEFIIIGSQSLHGKYPDLPDSLVKSFEVDLMASKNADRTEWLNVIGVDSPFHESFGYYADPVDHKTATLPKGWKGRLVNLPAGDTEGVQGLCLDPNDLAIAKYVARREKDIVFTSELATRGIVSRDRLLELLDKTPVSKEVRGRIRAHIARDFGVQKELNETQPGLQTGRESICATGSLNLEEIRAQARKDWLKLRQQQPGKSLSGKLDRDHDQQHDSPLKDQGTSIDDDAAE
ncbi:MAG: DUF6036 family nucleotidyltransferase [Steroidobacteraceae bacterium]